MMQSTLEQLQRLVGEDGLVDVHITAHDDVLVTHVGNPVAQRGGAIAVTDDELLAAVNAIGGRRR